VRYPFGKNGVHIQERVVHSREMTDEPINIVHNELVALMLKHAPSAKLFEHPECRKSKESMETRYKASGERVTGAKALLVKLDVRD
jgi:hypothetical protein